MESWLLASIICLLCCLSLRADVLPKIREHSESLPENYTLCDRAVEPQRFQDAPSANSCEPKDCYTDCLCNHVAVDGFCEKDRGDNQERCVCYHRPGHPRFQIIGFAECLRIREPFFMRSKFAMMQGCNQICRSDCLCNHGAVDGLCSIIHGLAFCSCIYEK